MATANRKEGASAPSNIVRLPTAARRKVQQGQLKADRLARDRFREDHPWPGDFRFGAVREAEKVALAISDVERTPGLRIAVAILQSIDAAQRGAVIAKLSETAGFGGDANAAFHIARLTGPISLGESLDIARALERFQ